MKLKKIIALLAAAVMFGSMSTGGVRRFKDAHRFALGKGGTVRFPAFVLHRHGDGRCQKPQHRHAQL